MMVAVTVLVLAALPLGLALDNLRRLKVPPLALGMPRISVLIPARNEEAHIGAAAAAVLASTGVDLELCVLDDGSTDATPAILMHGCTYCQGACSHQDGAASSMRVRGWPRRRGTN
jgi:cellulose synthase/poly-beta-1,6-N-acetylglucosamine synthase-like glycosyltransferase